MSQSHKKRKSKTKFPGGERFSRKQAAKYLGTTPGTLAKWASIGYPNIPYHRVGGKAIYIQDDLDTVLANGRVEGVDA